MKVLVISNTPWDDSNSFGNTFSNLFFGIEDAELYNLCLRNGVFNNSVVSKAVQLTDRSVLKSIYSPSFDPCMVMTDGIADSDVNQEISVNARKRRRFISFLIRDLIWKLGRWKKSHILNEFLEEIKPDVIYLPTYTSKHLCDVQLYVINKLNIPVVLHMTDDDYGCDPRASFATKWYKKGLRRKFDRIISKCSYIEVFAETMKEEYEKTFGKTCYVIGKGINIDELEPIKYEKKQDNISFVYTGNIGDERYRSLYQIGKALDEYRTDKEVTLNIYSATPLTDEMEQLFASSPSIKFHGAVSKAEVEEIQKNADYLVHAEGFSERAIFSVRMSFSTKIIDYLVKGKPMLAVGPYEVNSIKVLKDENIAVVATAEDEIKARVAEILDGSIDLDEIGENVQKYLVEKRDIKKIQAGIKARLDGLVDKK